MRIILTPNAPMSGAEVRSTKASAPLMKWTPPALFGAASVCQSRVVTRLLIQHQEESTHEV